MRRFIYAVCVVALFFAFSRTIATFAIVVVGVELWHRESPRWARCAWMIAAVIFAGALSVSLRYHVVLNPVEPWMIDVLPIDGDRFGRWPLAVDSIVENPIFGIGPGVPVANGWSAHNTWMNLWAGLGIVPLAAFAFLMLRSIRAVIGLRLFGVACALIFALIESIYNDIEDMRTVWLLIGIALGAEMNRRQMQR
jgi:O-antigen ligase